MWDVKSRFCKLTFLTVSCTLLQNSEGDVRKKGCHWLYMTHNVCTLQDLASSYPPLDYLNFHQLAYVDYLNITPGPTSSPKVHKSASLSDKVL